MSEFLHMGGYGGFVWSAYGIALLVLIANVWFPLQAHRQLRKRAKRISEQEQD